MCVILDVSNGDYVDNLNGDNFLESRRLPS